VLKHNGIVGSLGAVDSKTLRPFTVSLQLVHNNTYSVSLLYVIIY